MQTPFGEIPDRHLAQMSMAEAHDYLRARRVTRRDVLRATALGAAAVVAGPLLSRRAGLAATPPAAPHVQFGADPRGAMAVSWHTVEPVTNPRLELIGLGGDPVAAETRSVAGHPTVYHHVGLSGLEPDTAYAYRLTHDGASSEPEGTFRTAPSLPGPFTFTAFGDQGVSTNGAATTARVRAIEPAFHFHTGDLCYAYQTGTGDVTKPAPIVPQLQSRIVNQAVWDNWLKQVTPVAAGTPWMPTVGNHEMEYGYGPLGYDAYLARFALPGDGTAGTPTVYAVRYGNVALVALDGNDVSVEISANRGYTGGAQATWIDATLGALRADPSIDFIVVGYHNCNYCTNVVHASDDGVRGWEPLFDRHQVDLVINGHNHCYERSHPIRARSVTRDVGSGSTIAPATDGTTYITAGGGGQAAYQAALYPASYVTVWPGVRVPESGEFSAFRYLDISFIACDVAPRTPDSPATLTVRALRPDGTEIERVTLAR